MTTRTLAIGIAIFGLLTDSGLAGPVSPGGLGTSDVTLWLDAGVGVENPSAAPAGNGNNVQFWRDQSGTNDAIQTNAARQPAYNATGGPKGGPRVTFQGNPTGGSSSTHDWIPASNLGNVNSFSLFAVTQRNNTHQIDPETTNATTGTGGQNYLFGPHIPGGSGSGAGVSVGTNGISVYEHAPGYMPPLAVYNGSVGNGYNTIGVEYVNKQPSIYLNGGLVHTGLTSPRSGDVEAPYEIGGNSSYGGLDGSIAEVIIFNRNLNTTEKVLVNNYLAAKHGLTTSVDRYAGDAPSNGDFDLGVFGVGQTSASDNVTTAMSGGLSITAAGLEDADYVLAGHREPTNALVEDRWTRSFFIDVTDPNNSVSATLEFDFSDSGLDPELAGATDWQLLYAADENSSFSGLGKVAPNGDVLSFGLSPEQLQSGIYALKLSPVPEPSSIVLMATVFAVGAIVTARRHRRV